MKLDDLIKPLGWYKKINKENPIITSIEMDSREVTKGSLFICIDGFTVDGHNFVAQAVEKGAVAVVCEKEVQTSIPVVYVNDTKRALAMIANYFYEHPTSKFPLIGVTGTNGKTTVTHLINQILQDASLKTGLIGTMYSKIGDETIEAKNTTPESLALQKLFYKMNNNRVDVGIMEVSSHALHLGRVRGCDFNIAVFTNLTPDHLDYHETMEAYKYAKGLLFAQLGNTYLDSEEKVAVLNADDPVSKDYSTMTAARVITYGIEKKCDIRAANIQMTPSGTSFDILTPAGDITISMKLIGKFSVYNALAATAACLAYGIDLARIKESIEKVDGVAGRFEPIDEGQSFSAIVDYAHTPDSLENVLKTVREITNGRICVVVGCGGDRDRTKRPIMAKIAVDYSDHVIFTSDNPRSEDPLSIIKDMEKGVETGSYRVIIDRKQAINEAIKGANQGDCIVIAGKGHETYQIIGNVTYEFDDREVARKAIKEHMQ